MTNRAKNPFRFWVNNDDDEPDGTENVPAVTPDNRYAFIRGGSGLRAWRLRKAVPRESDGLAREPSGAVCGARWRGGDRLGEGPGVWHPPCARTCGNWNWVGEPLAHFFDVYDRRPAKAILLILHVRPVLQAFQPNAPLGCSGRKETAGNALPRTV